MTSAIQNNLMNSSYSNIANGSSSADYKQSQVSNTQTVLKVSQENIDSQTSQEQEKETLKELVKNTNKQMEAFNNNLQFQYHDDAGILSVAVVNSLTHEEIRRMPSKEAIDLLSSMRDIIGKIFDTQA